MKRITMDLKSQTQSERVKIRIEYNGELQFCDVGLTNLTKQSFLRDVSTFIDIENTSKIKIYDNRKAAIPIRDLEEIIRKYEKGQHFSLRIEVLMNNDGDEMSTHAFILMKELKTFLIEKHLKHLTATGKNGKVLNKSERGQVIRETAEMMVEKYGMYPNKVQFNGIANALNCLLPQWTIQEAHNSLSTRFRNMRAAQKSKNKKAEERKGAIRNENDTADREETPEYVGDYDETNSEPEIEYIDDQVEDEDGILSDENENVDEYSVIDLSRDDN